MPCGVLAAVAASAGLHLLIRFSYGLVNLLVVRPDLDGVSLVRVETGRVV